MIMSNKTKEIELVGGPPWGFRIGSCTATATTSSSQPPSSTNQHKIKIARVNPCSKASAGGVRDGDIVVQINGQPTNSLSTSDVHSIMKAQTLKLVLENPQKPVVATGLFKRKQQRGDSGDSRGDGGSGDRRGGDGQCSSKDDKIVAVVEGGTESEVATALPIVTIDVDNNKNNKNKRKSVKKKDKKKRGEEEEEGISTQGQGGGGGQQRDIGGGVKAGGGGTSLLGEIIAELDDFLEQDSEEVFKDKSRRACKGPSTWIGEAASSGSTEAVPCLLKEGSESSGSGGSLQEEEACVVWTPPSLPPSPSTHKKFRPVPFVPSSSPTGGGGGNISKPHTLTLDITNPGGSVGVSQSVLPKYPSPTVTLLQKAREGHLPKGAHYLEEPVVVDTVADKEERGRTAPGVIGSLKRSAPSPQQSTGLSSAEPELPVVSKSVVVGGEEKQREWYKRMYESIHVERVGASANYNINRRQPVATRKADIVRYSPGGGRRRVGAAYIRGNGGNQSEPEYDTCGEERLRDSTSTVALSPGIRFRAPGRIEDYTPGLQKSYRGGGSGGSRVVGQQRTGSLEHWATKELGYESDSYVIRKRGGSGEGAGEERGTESPVFSPAEQRQLYVEIQKGGEVPIQGLRKLAPDRLHFSNSNRDLRMEPPIEATGQARRSMSPTAVPPTRVSMLQTRLQEKLDKRCHSDLGPGSGSGGGRSASASRLIRSVRAGGGSLVRSQSAIPVAVSGGSGGGGRALVSTENLHKSQADLMSPREVKKVLNSGGGAQHKLSIQLQVVKPNKSKVREVLSMTVGTSGGPRGSGGGSGGKAAKKKQNGGNVKGTGSTKSVKISEKVSVQNGGSRTLNNGGPVVSATGGGGGSGGGPVSGGPIPQKPPRKAKNGTKLPQPIISNRHVGCLSPTTTASHSRSTSPAAAGLAKGGGHHFSRASEASLISSRVAAKPKPILSRAAGKGAPSLRMKTGGDTKVNNLNNVPADTLPPPPPVAPIHPLPAKPTTDRPSLTNDRKWSSALHRSSSLRSLPTLTPYLSETRRVTNSVFLLPPLSTTSACTHPRPTKTSIMRELRASEHPRLPRSQSCVTLHSNYPEYILKLRHSRSRSPRFTKLTKLYSSLERLSMLERSTSLYDMPVLSSLRRHDFDAWWKVRNRLRIEREMADISGDLLKAQKEREFFYKPAGGYEPWTVDSRLRGKQFSVGEIQRWLTAGVAGAASGATAPNDVRKVNWRGSGVKELALNLEVNELYKTKYYDHQQQLEREFYARTPFLRRAFSMSSTLSSEQREFVKQRIGRLIELHHKHVDKQLREEDDKRVVTSRMGFTTSSLPYKPDVVTGVGAGAAGGLTESAKKELSRTLSAEFKDRKSGPRNFLRNSFPTIPDLPVSTKIALRKHNNMAAGGGGQGGRAAGTGLYSVYCSKKVPERVKIFEKRENNQEKVARIVKTGALMASPSARRSPTPTDRGGRRSATPTDRGGYDSRRSATPTDRSRYDSKRSATPTPTERPPQTSNQWPGQPTPPEKYMSHLNIISKLASMLLKRDTPLKNLVTRELLERDKLDRLRYLNSGEVNRLRDYFEHAHYYTDDLHSAHALSSEINLLRCLFCSDPNLSKIAGSEYGKAAERASSQGASDDHRLSPEYFSKRSRKVIYHGSSTPNVCQPTLTAHCHLEAEPGENYYSSLDNSYSSAMNFEPAFFAQPRSPADPQNYVEKRRSPSPPAPPQRRRILDDRLQVDLFKNFDPALHQPAYRYQPPPPATNTTASYYGQSSLPTIGLPGLPPPPVRNVGHGGGGLWRSESLNSGSHQQWQPWHSSRPVSQQSGGSSYYNTRRVEEFRPSFGSPISTTTSSLYGGGGGGGGFNDRPGSSLDQEIRLIENSSRHFFDETNDNSSYSCMSPLPRYVESSVNIHYRAPVRLEEKLFVGEEELRRRQEEAMKLFYSQQRERKFIKEIMDQESRRHSDHLLPSQKSPIPLNRYDDDECHDEDLGRRKIPKWRQQPKQLAKALFNFVPQNERELGLLKGDVVGIRRKLDANWYEGEHEEAIGIFPANHVQLLASGETGPQRSETASLRGTAVGLYDFKASSPLELSILRGERVALTRRVDANWFEGTRAGRRGIFPVNFVRVDSEPVVANNKAHVKAAAPHHYKPNEFVLGGADYGEVGGGRLTIDTTTGSGRGQRDQRQYRSLFNYAPAHSDELELREDDLVEVLEKCDDGWFVGTSCRTGLFGTFPGNYVSAV